MADRKITLTYVNIRQSIAILIAKIFLIDFLMAVLVILSYFALITGASFANYDIVNTPLFLGAFIILGFVKVIINSYVILQWLNEYYEITSEYVIHKQGIIFKKTEKYRIDYIREIDIQDTFLGEIFNYATITINDVRRTKYFDMYLIHNPRRYANILKQLRPHIEMKEDRVSVPFIKTNNENSDSSQTISEN